MVLEFQCNSDWSVTSYTAVRVRPSSGNLLFVTYGVLIEDTQKLYQIYSRLLSIWRVTGLLKWFVSTMIDRVFGCSWNPQFLYILKLNE